MQADRWVLGRHCYRRGRSKVGLVQQALQGHGSEESRALVRVYGVCEHRVCSRDHLSIPSTAVWVRYPWLVELSAAVEVSRRVHWYEQMVLRRVFLGCLGGLGLGGLARGDRTVSGNDDGKKRKRAINIQARKMRVVR